MTAATLDNLSISRAYQAEYKRRAREAGKDIGPPPEPQNVERVEACRKSLKLFCESYYPDAFSLAWSEDHLRIIDRLEQTVINGGLFAIAMPRGSGKTTLIVRAAEWAILYGHKKFVCIIGATQPSAASLLKAIKTNFTHNPELLTDFPSAIYPIQCLENEPRRCMGQTINGEPTAPQWGADSIVMPTVRGSICSGSVVTVRGITGEIRGQQHTTPNGEILRPDYVLLDDPQTRESASSPSQTASRSAIVNGDVLGLGGPGVKMAGVTACTKIRANDLADRMLDREVSPEWQGECTKMMYSFPSNLELWDQYRELRSEAFMTGGDLAVATEFYRANREAMDLGANPAWPARFNPDEISAIQHAMNLKFRDEPAFFAEYQNAPLDDSEAVDETIERKGIERIIGPVPRRVVPAWASKVTAFVDVQGGILWYLVAAWGDGFRGAVLDYGAYPDQKQRVFTKASARYSYRDLLKGQSFEAQLYAALDAVTVDLMSRSYKVENSGATMEIERCLIDANWPGSTETVYRVINESSYKAALRGSRGVGYKDGIAPVATWKKKPGDSRAWHAVERRRDNRNSREVSYQTDRYKTFLMHRINTPDGGGGSLQVYKDKPHKHEMLFDHLASEYPSEIKHRGITVNAWKERGGQDNDLWDCLVGSAVAAALCGVEIPGQDKAKPRKAKRRGKKVSYI